MKEEETAAGKVDAYFAIIIYLIAVRTLSRNNVSNN